MPASGHRTRSPGSLQLKADSAQSTSSQRPICEHCFWQRPAPRQQCFLLTEHPGTSIHLVSASSQSARAGPTRKLEESHVDGHHLPAAKLPTSHLLWRPSRHCDAQPGHAALRKTDTQILPKHDFPDPVLPCCLFLNVPAHFAPGLCAGWSLSLESPSPGAHGVLPPQNFRSDQLCDLLRIK
ncbi:uncharacterized protein LOC133097577 isoform X2 [Eubalaena glacialis]|uniref:uncharacterized protein LOC133097577 isoform X2 n=1 Tax=Eubalaena glacialis TaxID=27606 RepID=UPI002A5ABA6E|nr:uncharacterized protein LOC133097577 isoform X2 [Eubalaena glacialis]